MHLVLLLLVAFTSGNVPEPIAAARQRTIGDEVLLLGTVTVPSGRFRAAADEGFALHDQTGGIWISTNTNHGFREGRVVLVKGKVAKSAGKLQIAASEVAQRNDGLRIATGRVGGATAGHIITIEGTIQKITDDAPYGKKVFIDDGSGAVQVFLNASTDIDGANLRPGRTIRVTGFSSQYESTYEVEPRSRADVEEK